MWRAWILQGTWKEKASTNRLLSHRGTPDALERASLERITTVGIVVVRWWWVSGRWCARDCLRRRYARA
jgi:hypothetical protein